MDGNSGTRNSKELDSGGVICPLEAQPRDTTQLFAIILIFIFHQEVNEKACMSTYAYIEKLVFVVSVVSLA